MYFGLVAQHYHLVKIAAICKICVFPDQTLRYIILPHPQAEKSATNSPTNLKHIMSKNMVTTMAHCRNKYNIFKGKNMGAFLTR